MKSFYLFVLSVLMASGLRAQSLHPSDAQVLKAISTRTKEEVSSVEYFRGASPELAWEAFEYLSKWAEYYNRVDLAKRAGLVIAENPRVEKYVTEGMTALPYEYNNEAERYYFLNPLGYVPAPWSLRLLGRYLIDETPMSKIPKNPDYDSSLNWELAIISLTRMGFSDAPPEDPRGITPAVAKGWREWWKKNEPIVEQRIREINPGYYPPQPVAQIATPAATPKPTVIGEYAATPAAGHIPKPTPSPSATPVALAPANQSDWAIYIIGGLIAFGALAVVGWALRRR